MSGNNGEVLRCQGICKSFYVRNKEFPVLKGIDLELRQGEAVLISGRSGAGKSTLISILAGLEPQTSGKISWQGRTVFEGDWAKLRQEKLGIIFQEYNLIRSWTAFENIEAPLLFRRISEKERRESVGKIAEKLEISHVLNNKPAEMSEGQQQRVAIARTLILSPALLFADEPVGGVDPETGEVITSMLLSMLEDERPAILITTHGGSSISRIAGRSFVLSEGRLEEA